MGWDIKFCSDFVTSKCNIDCFVKKEKVVTVSNLFVCSGPQEKSPFFSPPFSKKKRGGGKENCKSARDTFCPRGSGLGVFIEWKFRDGRGARIVPLRVALSERGIHGRRGRAQGPRQSSARGGWLADRREGNESREWWRNDDDDEELTFEVGGEASIQEAEAGRGT